MKRKILILFYPATYLCSVHSFLVCLFWVFLKFITSFSFFLLIFIPLSPTEIMEILSISSFISMGRLGGTKDYSK